jgi:putative flippase GtrA
MTAPARPRRSQLRASAARSAAQFARFLVVGLGNTVISFVLYTALVLAGAPYWAAGALAFCAGAANGYVFNRRWTFAVPDSAGARARYLVVQLGGLGGTTGLLWTLVSAGTGRIGAYAATIPVVTAATFAVNRGWTFAPV